MQTDASISSTRFRWVDLLRALGALLVVIAHVTYAGAGSAFVRNGYYSLTRVAVPLFFISSGFLLLSKEESYSDFFRKRALKTFVPLIIWSVIYLLWHQEGFGSPLASIIKSYFIKILRGPRENHLWFFYELFGLYLFTPILRLYVGKASIRDLWYFFGLWLILTPGAILLETFTPLRIGFASYFLSTYIGYFIFGHIARRLEVSPLHVRFALAVLALGLVIMIGGPYVLRYYNISSDYFNDYLSIGVVFASCALFVLFARVSISDGVFRFVLPLSQASLGIYLAHVLVMGELFSLGPFGALLTIGDASYMIPLLGILSFCCTYLLVLVLQKIPILRMMVP